MKLNEFVATSQEIAHEGLATCDVIVKCGSDEYKIIKFYKNKKDNIVELIVEK